jgi:hypothetical protein
MKVRVEEILEGESESEGESEVALDLIRTSTV